MHRPVSSILMCCLLLVGLPACSEEPPPEFADGTWASKHRTEIEVDCDRRIMCAERTNMYLREDAFEHCVTTNARNLNDEAMFQFRFEWLLGRLRCTQPDVCAYVDCIDSTYVSYGQSQFDKVDNTCKQKLQCATEMNTLGVPPYDYYESCLVQTTVQLDAFSNQMQSAYQSQYFQCTGQTSCAFLFCFPY